VKRNVTDARLILEALGIIRAETEGFEPLSEGISRFNTDEGSHPFNRYDEMSIFGNKGRPDGERYKGRGYAQLTGRANYEKYSEKLGLDLVNQPELANDPEVAADVLASFIADVRNQILAALIGNDLATARRLANGGSHALDRFTETYTEGLKAVSERLRLGGQRSTN
jgi:putative chitinase